VAGFRLCSSGFGLFISLGRFSERWLRGILPLLRPPVQFRSRPTDPLVHRVRVTISPDNVASSGLVAQYGFTEVGEQWDDEDGLEIIYEIDA
jgi:hypothetical protein